MTTERRVMTDLFSEACRRFNVQPDRRGECLIECPNCRAPVKAGQVHFSFNAAVGHCFRCDWSCSLAQLLGLPKPSAYLPPPRIVRPKPAPDWRWDAEDIIREACRAPDRVQRWLEYRPLSLESMAHWRLGVHVVPATSCRHRRLMFPVRKGGRIVAICGRRLECPPDCPHSDTKMIVATGSETVLFNGDALKPGADVVVTENRVDAILAGQHWPEIVAVAAGSCSYWKSFVEQIVFSRPKRVTIWFDNDAPGCPNAETFAAHVREVQAAGKKPLEPHGIQFVNALRERGVNAEPWPWPAETERKYDAGAFLTDLVRGRRVA